MGSKMWRWLWKLQRVKMARILQLNVNHSAPSQDNLLHLMEELNAGIAAIAEPHKVPQGNAKWIGSKEKPPRAAMVWRKCRGLFAPLQALKNGTGYCFARWNGIVVGSCYCSPKLR